MTSEQLSLGLAMCVLFGFKEMGLAQPMNTRLNRSSKEEPRAYQVQLRAETPASC